jgi:hypothetical protein
MFGWLNASGRLLRCAVFSWCATVQLFSSTYSRSERFLIAHCACGSGTQPAERARSVIVRQKAAARPACRGAVTEVMGV